MASDDSIHATDGVAAVDVELHLMQRVAEASAIAVCVEAELADVGGSTLIVRKPISQADASRRVRSALEVAASRNAIAMHALRIAVCEFTFALRSEGITPEAVLITLKNLIDNRALPQIVPHQSDWNGDLLRESISTWCIKAYFDSEGACV